MLQRSKCYGPKSNYHVPVLMRGPLFIEQEQCIARIKLREREAYVRPVCGGGAKET